MKNDLEIVFKYIKNYKIRSLAIILSVVLSSALIVGVGTLSSGAQQQEINSLERETGKEHVIFKDINKEQLESIKTEESIDNIGLTSYYASTDVGEKLPINIVYADEKFLNNESELLKGRLPKEKNEVVIQEWVLNSMGLEPNINQEIEFKLYNKENPEKFKIVGILKDRYKDKSIGRCEMFLGMDPQSTQKYNAYVIFNKDTDMYKSIDNIAKKAKLEKKQVRKNSMLISAITSNGSLKKEDRNTAIVLSLFSGIVIYSVYIISIYQRVREYGVLRAIGCTNFRVFKLMLLELLSLTLISLPVGIILGMGGAEVFNKLAGNLKIEGTATQAPFVIPTKTILLTILCVLTIMVLISILTYIKVRRISPIDAIRKNFNKDKIKRSNFIVSKMSKKIAITRYISFKNIFRNKMAFLMIIMSMSIGGIMILRDNYSISGMDERREKGYKDSFWNADFMLKVNGTIDEENGLKDENISEMQNIKGIDNVKTAKMLDTRMPIKKDKMLELNYYDEELKQGGYTKSVLNGLYIDDKNSSDYILKQKLKGYNNPMLESLKPHVISGEINEEKMENENLAVIYVPHVYQPYKEHPDYYEITNSKVGKPIVDIKVGDTVKVKYPKGKIDTEKYWKGQDNYDYNEYEFKVGAIVDYPFADDNMYTSESGVDVIINDKQFKKLTNLNNYDVVYLETEPGADNKAINKKLGKIGSKTPGTTTINMQQEKEKNTLNDKKFLMFNYGIALIVFIISMFTIINNVSYNLFSRTSEFGMLRAVGIDDKSFRNMIIYEGLLYGVFSSTVVVVVSLILQMNMYKSFGFEDVGMEFVINYKLYAIIVIVNILLGLLATFLPSRKIKKTNIVDAINIVE